MSDLVETWRVHARIVLYVLDAVPDDALDAPSVKGRTVGHQFSHMHDVRRMWLTSSAPDLAGDVEKLGKDHTSDKVKLTDALTRSAEAVAQLIERAETDGRVKGFKPSPTAFVGYLISHESYHQGDLGVRLTESGFPLDKKVAFGMWEWGVR
jgi:uncharacterized damage-inducible protein DinB